MDQTYLKEHIVKRGFLPSHPQNPTCKLGNSVVELDDGRIIFDTINSLDGTIVPLELILFIEWTDGRQK